MGTPVSIAEVGGARDRAQDLGRLEELLGRDAAPVETRPADPVLLDERDVQAGRGAVQRGRVAGRATAEDHDVELLGQNGHLLELPRSERHGTDRSSRADPAILPGGTPSPVIPFPKVHSTTIGTALTGRCQAAVQRASRIWTAPAVRMATPVMAARMSRVRVLTTSSSRPSTGPAGTRSRGIATDMLTRLAVAGPVTPFE